LLKKVVNYSVGFYGQSGQKQNARYYLTNKMPRHSNLHLHNVVEQYDVRDWSSGLVLFVYKTISKKQSLTMSKSYLPFHVTVIENGKLRLVEFILLLQKYLFRGSFKLLYSNVDSFHIAFGNENILKLVNFDDVDTFKEKYDKLVGREKTLGKFYLDWTVKDKFMYVSARIQNYAVVAADVNKSKWSGINSVVPLETYFKSCELLTSGTAVSQERRVDKLQNLNREIKILFCKPTNK